jgi:alpha-galactosidase
VKNDFASAGAVDGLRHGAVTAVEAYRCGLHVVKDALGPDATLLGCDAAVPAAAGLVDALRVGPDVALRTKPATADPSTSSQRQAACHGVAPASQYGRSYVEDPDRVVVRPEMEIWMQWAATVERDGGLRSSSDRLRSRDAWGLEATRRLLVSSSAEPLVPPVSPVALDQEGRTQ